MGGGAWGQGGCLQRVFLSLLGGGGDSHQVNVFFGCKVTSREETKGFCQRAVVANISSFRLWGPGRSKIMASFCQGSTAGKDF